MEVNNTTEASIESELQAPKEKEEFIHTNNPTRAIKNEIRNVPHVEGNFAAFIYLKVSNSQLGSKFFNLLNTIEKHFTKYKNLQNDGYNPPLPLLTPLEEYHISLSPTLYLKHHQLSSFLNMLKMRLKCFKQGLQLILSDKVKSFSNEYKSRGFLSLEISKSKAFSKVYSAVFEVLESFNCADMAKPPGSFTPHISLFSFLLEEKSDIMDTVEESIRRIIPNLSSKGYLKIFTIEEVCVKIGSKVERISLVNN